MKAIYALAISSGLLVGAWIYLGGITELHITPWIGLVSTAALFFCGGGLDGAKKVLGTGVAGILLAALTVLAITKVGGGLPVTAIAIGILAFVLVAMSALPGLSATPASFLGGCVFFAAGAKLDETILYLIWSWVLGLALGYLVGALGKRFEAAPEV
ncbi:DUF1097 domain-containing protein [Bradyrhizobium sp. AUGA SZCCT0177]|uniref:DUF1097 domain-containing protein n=1 Tax=Bradyrhizobium sp. AUGA SZCCT0177 TaxID=2807665 RepID=UPI001BAAD942|nr:DUF1097 domain-containing protein [Bradyrhizobium sp. AUGA SZCCT0177]MBR1281522.1 DUF1097 domain-containing protein [Bradyrhizobium sp. AUGA SZCCT0177]